MRSVDWDSPFTFTFNCTYVRRNALKIVLLLIVGGQVMKTMAIVIAVCAAIAVGSADAKGSKSSGTTASGGYGSGSKSSSTYVRGHVTKSGTYVAPHRKTAPDHTQRNNYSARGNYNPYTGKTGGREPRK